MTKKQLLFNLLKPLVGTEVRVYLGDDNIYGDGEKFYAKGALREVRDDICIIEFPPIQDFPIRESDDPEDETEEELYAIRCRYFGARGKHWVKHNRVSL